MRARLTETFDGWSQGGGCNGDLLTSRSGIGKEVDPDGTCLSATDWRANRLADVLAKEAAKALAADSQAVQLLEAAEEAAKHAFAMLGTVTWYANNHKAVKTVNGVEVGYTKRDSCSAPIHTKERRRSGARAGEEAVRGQHSDELPSSMVALAAKSTKLPRETRHEACSLKAAATALHRRSTKQNEEAALKSVVAGIASKLHAPPEAASGASRLAALRERVLSKLSM